MADWSVQTPVSTIRPTVPRAKAVAASGGASIFGAIDDLSTAGGGATTDGAGVTVVLSARSTVAVVASAQFAGTDSFFAAFNIRVDASPTRFSYGTSIEATQTGAGAAFNAALNATGVITLAAGSYLFYTRGTTVNNSNAVSTSAVLTIIVGSNTEEDTFL